MAQLGEEGVQKNFKNFLLKILFYLGTLMGKGFKNLNAYFDINILCGKGSLNNNDLVTDLKT